MRPLLLPVLTLGFLCGLPTAPFAQDLQDIIKRLPGPLPGIAQTAIAKVAEAEWNKLPQNERACVTQKLRGRGDGIQSLAQRGIFPTDPRVASLRSECHPSYSTPPSPAAPPTAAFAQASNDAPITQCDTYAANPLDPQRKTPGVPKERLNPALAIPACRSALGNFLSSPRLKYQLGRSYHVANNFREAVAYYQQAAQYGYVIAETSLGQMSQNGEGIPQNYRDALSWSSKAASKGFAPAQNNLGVLYETGQGAPKNLAQAREWYRKAAAQGLPGAQDNFKRVDIALANPPS